MPAERQISAKPLLGIAFTLVLLAIGLWAVPRVAGASDASPLVADINVPGEANNQWCVAYSNSTGGVGSYTFQWSGDWFSGTGSSSLAYVEAPGWVYLDVWDSATPKNHSRDEVYLQGAEETGSDFCDAQRPQ